MYAFSKAFIPLLLCLVLVHSYVQLDDYNKMLNYYSDNSLIPIIQIYYNRHFSTSRQFDQFRSALEETEYKNKDFSRYALINCEKIKEEGTPCDDLKRTKDNRKIVVYYPSTEFIKYGGKKLQNPHQSRVFNNRKDVVLANQYEVLLEEIMPNFFEEITSLEDYYDWVKPRHIPKLVFLSRQQEIPMVMKKLGVHYFLKYDLAYVSDLTESIVNKMNITTFPKLLVINFNYPQRVYDIFQYKESDFSAASYHKIKQFLDQYALPEPRNDLLYQKIKIPAQSELQTVHKRSEVHRFLDSANGWIIISEVKGQPVQLKALKEKYGRFFEYIHFQNGNETEILGLYDKEKEESFGIDGQIQFKALSKQEFLKGSAIWLAKKYVVISVREKYGYFCAIERAALFKDLTHCLIIKESDYEEAYKALNIPFDIGFAYYQTSAKVTEKLVGRTFKSTDFEEIYQTVELLSKRKTQQVVEDFKKQPVQQIQKTDALQNICAFPNKRCALLFTHGSKRDRTAQEYLSEIALNFINDYEFFEVDLTCNSHFQQEISNLKNNYGGLVVYHPKKKSYVSLKARLSKFTFDKFLKANLRDSKKLPFHEFTSQDIKINSCGEIGKTVETGNKENDSL